MRKKTVSFCFMSLNIAVSFAFFMSGNVVHAQSPETLPKWDIFSDTWDATDDLERSLPTASETGLPRKDKYIGMFYFLWNGRHGEEGPYDVNKILAQDPDAMQKKDSPLWGKMYVPHHWGESIFNYYVGEDEGVLRKHAQMLSDAGVDVIIFDVTNQLTYPESYRQLCKVFREVRAAGNHTPQIAFLTPFGTPQKVVKELWRDFYSKGDYKELWFQWQGKPLIMADPNLIETMPVEHNNTAHELKSNETFGQTFETKSPLTRVAVCTPTWQTKGSSVVLTLRKNGPKGEIVGAKTFKNVEDNEWLTLPLKKAVEPGTYCIELSQPNGKIGWWGKNPDQAFSGQGFVNGQPTEMQFVIRINRGSEETEKILDFFTFRKPQPDYFVGPTGPNQWGWLEVSPQHVFYALDENGNKVTEQMTVGIAQNAVDGKLGVLSNPRSYGRSFHNGKEPAPEMCDYTGRNFTEQWQRVFEIDPPFLFVTSWNEWIMGRFDETAPFHGAGVVSFVDQFNTEFSRDIEPMIGGHGDNYYYQLIANLRKFKGTRPVPSIESKQIVVDGKFEDWNDVMPEFRDTIGDPVKRDERGWGKGTRYVNQTGRNDIVASKVSYDDKNIYFYVRTAEPIVGVGEPNWMMLFLDTDALHKTGWLGYDAMVNRRALEKNESEGLTDQQVTHLTLEKNTNNKYEWASPVSVECRMSKNELELVIPKKLLFGSDSQTPTFFRFKWADNIQQTGEWSDFTLNGDVAPNDRYDYRAVLERVQ